MDSKNSLNRSITKFEEAKVIGVRAEMLARGSPPLVQLTDDMMRNGMYDVKMIAEKEFIRGFLPFDLKRNVGNNKMMTTVTTFRKDT